MNEAEVREKYPQYNDLPYSKLLEGLHAKHYSDMPYDEFAAKMGVSPQAPQQPQAPAPSFYDRLRESLMGVVSDPTATMRNAAILASKTAQNPFMQEVVGTVNRTVMDTADIIPKGVNAFIRAGGGEAQSPTLEGTIGQFGVGQQGYMPPGLGRDTAQLVGKLVPAAAGMVPVARAATAPGSIAADFFGIGSTNAAPVAGGQVSGVVDDIIGRPMAAKPEGDQLLAEQMRLLQNKIPDASVAGLKLDPMAGVIPDPLQKAVLKQGFEPRLTAMVNTWNTPTRRAGVEMLNRVRGSLANMADISRPSDVVGDLLEQRIKVIHSGNQMATARLGEEAEKLRKSYVDISEPLSRFDDELRNWDIEIDPDTKVLDFDRSQFQGDHMKDLRSIINSIYKRVNQIGGEPSGGTINAYEAHKAKRYIDRNVSFGKTTQKGIDAEVERVFKGLRHDIDGVLDSNFKGYDDVNSVYKETRDVLEGLESAIPSKIDIFAPNANKVLGAEMRKLLSNYSSRQSLENAFSTLDDVSRTYIKKGNRLASGKTIREATGVNALDDDLVQLTRYNSALEDMFGTNATQSAKGIAQSSGSRMASEILNPKQAVMGYVDEKLHQMRGINSEEALNAMERLLRGVK